MVQSFLKLKNILNEGTSRIKIVGKKAQGNAKLTLSDDFDGEIEAVSYTYPK